MLGDDDDDDAVVAEKAVAVGKVTQTQPSTTKSWKRIMSSTISSPLSKCLLSECPRGEGKKQLDPYLQIRNPFAFSVRAWRRSFRQSPLFYYILANDSQSEAQLFVPGTMYEQCSGGLPQSDPEAVRYYMLAENQGDCNAQYNLGTMTLYGQGRGGLHQNDA